MMKYQKFKSRNFVFNFFLYLFTPDDDGRVTACHVTSKVPSCGPGSTWMSYKKKKIVYEDVLK